MRSVFACLAFAALFVTPALSAGGDLLLPAPENSAPEKSTPAKEAAKKEPAKPELTHAQKLDALFAELKRERTEAGARRVVGRIWQEWSNSGSSSVDLMMGWAKKAMDEKKYDIALDFLDQVVTLEPAYPEGWNRRATLHFTMHNFQKSMADIEQTLELEPRHFGAMSGMAQIMMARGSKQAALGIYEQVLAIYPMDRDAQNQISTLAEELAGQGI